MPGYLPGAAGFSTYVRILPDGVSRSTTVSVMVRARTGATARARGAARAPRRLSSRSGALAAASRLDSRLARGVATHGAAQADARAPPRACGVRPHVANAPCSKLSVAMPCGGGGRGGAQSYDVRRALEVRVAGTRIAAPPPQRVRSRASARLPGGLCRAAPGAQAQAPCTRSCRSRLRHSARSGRKPWRLLGAPRWASRCRRR
jgi:hypothetical protein